MFHVAIRPHTYHPFFFPYDPLSVLSFIFFFLSSSLFFPSSDLNFIRPCFYKPHFLCFRSLFFLSFALHHYSLPFFFPFAFVFMFISFTPNFLSSSITLLHLHSSFPYHVFPLSSALPLLLSIFPPHLCFYLCFSFFQHQLSFNFLSFTSSYLSSPSSWQHSCTRKSQLLADVGQYILRKRRFQYCAKCDGSDDVFIKLPSVAQRAPPSVFSAAHFRHMTTQPSLLTQS